MGDLGGACKGGRFEMKDWAVGLPAYSKNIEGVQGVENDLFYIESNSKYAKGGMINVKSDDGEDLMYKIDTDEKYIEVDENTKKYLSDIALVMDRNFRKLKDTYIFWYDDMSDSDITELEEVFQTSLNMFAKGGNVWDEDLNVYTLVSSKEYFGTDTASDKRRWFRRNGRGLTRDQAKRMAQDYIDRYGKERVYIGNIRHYR